MNNIKFKSTQISKRHSSIKATIYVTLSLIFVTLLLFFGRVDIELVKTDATQNDDSDNSQDSLIDEKQQSKKEQPLDNEQQEILRQKYVTEMQHYKAQIEPQIADLNLPAWSPESSTDLKKQEENTISAFANSQYTEALEYLDDITKKILRLQVTQKENFESALKSAQQEFKENRYHQALTAIDQALLYKPENKIALEFKDRINVMETVSELVKAADIAKTENNLAEEISLLQQAIQYDSHRKDLSERHRQLVQKQNQQTIDQLLKQASQALEYQDIEQAQEMLSQIKQIDAKHPSLSLLTDKLKETKAKSSYRKLLTEAAIAEKGDDWQAVEQYYKQAQQIFPNNEDLKKRLFIASQINGYMQKIKHALSRPERLSDSQISAAMKQLAQDSTNYIMHSMQLQQLVAELDDTINKMSTLVPVTVYSDNKTDISVNGVGRIGYVDRYTLKEGLKPGRYLFKGERIGFRDKLIEVYIKYAQPIDVEVVCDEPI